jgi:sigma-B regulation protein RsbU (phosphoserine phosphatase)
MDKAGSNHHGPIIAARTRDGSSPAVADSAPSRNSLGKANAAPRGPDSKHKLDVLLHMSHVLGQEIHLDRMLAVMVSEVTRAMGAERTSLFLYDETKNELYTKIAEGIETREIRLPLGVGIAGATAARRESIRIQHAYSDPRFNPVFDKESGFITRSILSTPILNKKDHLLGVVQVLNKCNGESFSDDDEACLRAIATHLGLTIERADLVESYVEAQKIQQSMRLARDIQMSLVPHRFPAFPGKPQIDIHARLKPALDVGGDLYDYFLLDEDHLCFVVGDVSDKGVHAALFMAMTRSAFKISAMPQQRPLITSIFAGVNRFLCENNQSQMFVTMLGGILDLRTGRIQYSDGGHEPPFVIRHGGHVEMVQKRGGLALGFVHDYPFTSGEIQLNPGDALVLYTDGVNEAMNEKRELFKASGIEKTLKRVPAGARAELVIDTLMADLTNFVGNATQSDDIAVVVLRYNGT